MIIDLCSQLKGLNLEEISLIVGDKDGTDYIDHFCSQMRLLKTLSVLESWINQICSRLSANSEEEDIVHNKCDLVFRSSSIEMDEVQECILHLAGEYVKELCSNDTFRRDVSGVGDWRSFLCVHTISSLGGLLPSNTDCHRLFEMSNVTINDLQECIFENVTAHIHNICTNGTSLKVDKRITSWLTQFCNLLGQVREELNSSNAGNDPLKCDYKSWSYEMFLNASLLATCKDLDGEGLKEVICQNATLYSRISQPHPWIVNYCEAFNPPQDGECFIRHWLEKLPIPFSFNATQLCKNPTALLVDLLDHFNQCEDQVFSWISNANYILQVFDYILDFSSLDHSEDEVQEVLSEAILLSSLSDNASFWASFNPNSSISILQTIDSYLKEETNRTLKNDLLNCFSEYLQMPRENLRKLLLSAENDSVKKLLSHVHRRWRQLQLSQQDKPALETLTAAFLQKFPRVTPDLFVDLSQFIPFMAVSDIQSFPVSLLLNDSVLAAIRDHSSDMRANQKRAFARRLLNTNTFGHVDSWPPHFLKSIQPLLPFLPISHFQQLNPEQLISIMDQFGNSSLDPARGRHVIRTILSSSGNLSRGDIGRLGRLICFVKQEEVQLLLASQSLSDTVLSTLLSCTRDGAIDTNSGVAHLLARHLRGQDISVLTPQNLEDLGGILAVLGINFLHKLSADQRSTVISSIDSVPLSTAQLHQLVSEIIQNINITVDTICRFARFLPGFSPSVLRSAPASVLASACPCFTPFLSQLTTTQKAVILDALRTVRSDDDGGRFARFGCLAPFIPLKDLAFDPESFLRNRSLFRNWKWSPQQAQFIFKKIRAASNITEHSIMFLGNVARGADCGTLQKQTLDSDFLELVRFLSGQHGEIRQSLRKCVIKELVRRPGILHNNVLLMGPKMVANLPLKMLNSLSNDSVGALLDHVTRHTACLLTLLPHQRTFLVEKALQFLGIGPLDEISGAALENLGALIAFVDEGFIRQINHEELLLRLDDLRGYCIPEGNKNSFGWMLTRGDVLGDTSGWTQSQLEYVDRLVFNLSPEDIHKLPKEVLTTETVEMVLRSEGRWGVSDIGRICRVQQGRSAQTVLLSKKLSLATRAVKNIVKRRREGIPNCIDIKATFPTAWSSSQLAGMADSEFSDCLEILTSDQDLSAEHLKTLLARTKQLYGSMRSMKPWQVLQLGQAVTQLSDRDLQDLDVSDLGILSFLGEMDGWNKKQRKVAFGSFLQRNGQPVPELEATTLTGLGHLICGMSVPEIERINPEEFSKAVLFIGGLILKCTEAQMEALAILTTQPQAFGPISKWGAEIFTEIGSIAAGLSDIALSSLVEEQIEGLRPSAISLITPSKLAVVFSTDQLSSFSNAQASAVTSKQYEKLSLEQRQAVSAAQYDGEIHQEQRGKNRAVLSVSSKPVALFLCLPITYYLAGSLT
ncbi:stereocilin-like isoform X2 [Scyliorhinus canicula]|uniref:stereocilin-like isoform X2 n=1 Tax=Scyliorhinus canicula TaxID=7830 RepID=UPI0018F696D8|nr:stereocilin-like isoform X2 [Scyliorhinus canicula]